MEQVELSDALRLKFNQYAYSMIICIMRVMVDSKLPRL